MVGVFFDTVFQKTDSSFKMMENEWVCMYTYSYAVFFFFFLGGGGGWGVSI